MARVLEFHVTGKKLLGGLLLTVVPISLAAIYLSGLVGERAERDAGQDLQTIAESVASHIRERVSAKVIEAALMASDAAVQEAVTEANRQYERVYEEKIREMLTERDDAWSTPAGQERAAAMLASPASEALRKKLQVQPALLRITVTDRRGGTVAATHKTIDYYQGDEEYWQDIFATGRGAVSLTDVLYDEASKHYYIGVGVPVVDTSNNMTGTLDALVDISQLFPLIHSNELGTGGRMALVHDDGTVITGTDGVSLSDRTVSEDFQAILDAQSQFGESSAGYVTAAFPQRRDRIVAFADTGLQQDHRRLNWFVVASQDAQEALGEVALTQFIILGLALLSLAAVVFLAVYFSLHTQSEIEEIEEQMAERPIISS